MGVHAMMSFITFPSHEAASEADARAFAYLRAEANAQGGSWSGVFTDGTAYAILFDSCIAGAFPDAVPVESDEFTPFVDTELEEPT